MTTKQVKLFTHGDLDGAVSAIMVLNAKNWSSDDVKYEVCQYNGKSDINARVNKYLDTVVDSPGDETEQHLVIADIGPSEKTCERIESLYQLFASAVVFDHHKTTLWAGAGKKFPWFHHSGNTACGAKMVWKALLSTESKKRFEGLVAAADAYDRWIVSSEHRERGEKLDLLFKFLGFSKFVDEFLRDPDADSAFHMKYLVTSLQERENEIVKSTVKQQLDHPGAVFVDGEGNRVAILMPGNEYVSKTGERVLQKLSEVDYVALVLPALGIVSLRSRKNGTDVSQVALKFGGGGHAAAAGFPVENLKETVLQLPTKLLEGMKDAE